MSEPPSISRRATAWWPAVIALEQVMDAITATGHRSRRGRAGRIRTGDLRDPNAAR
jgi:hypothetical protein